MSRFVELRPEQWEANVFSKIDRDWMLITAGTADKANTMTASWGGFGVLWNKDVSFIFVRPTRYTYEFLEREDGYSLCFFGEEQRKALQLCGRVSGRDTDKIAAAGLTLCGDACAPYFAQAETVVLCRKLYSQDLDPTRFLDAAIEGHYKAHDYHRLYVGEIVSIRQKQNG